VFPPCQHAGRLEVHAAADGPQYLASAVADDRGFGSARCPWTLVAPRGRRLNVTLLDFAVVAARHLHADAADVCHVYARIRQLPPAGATARNHVRSRGVGSRGVGPRAGGEVTVCAGRVRERPVFVSARGGDAACWCQHYSADRCSCRRRSESK